MICLYLFLGVYILIGAGSLVMLVGFFGCCGAVRESQCLLGSVSAYKQRSFQCYVISSRHLFFFCFFFNSIFVVFCLSADHFWCRGGSRGVWILEQRQGTFITSPLHHNTMQSLTNASDIMSSNFLTDHRRRSELLHINIQRKQQQHTDYVIPENSKIFYTTLYS